MEKEIYALDFSAPEILACSLHLPEVQHLELNLPWEVGFQGRDDGSLIACFGDDFKNLDPNAPNTVRFPDLEIYLKELRDELTLGSIFDAFAVEILEKRLPEMGYLRNEKSAELYVITPYQWQAVHRVQLRQALKSYHVASSLRGDTFHTGSRITLKSCVSEIFCAIAYYFFRSDNRSELTNALADSGEPDLFIFDFRKHELKIWLVGCSQTESEQIFEIRDIRIYPDYLFEEEEELIQAINAFIKAEQRSKEQTVLRGFGVIDPQRVEFVTSLLAQYYEEEVTSQFDLSAFESHYNAPLEGLAALIECLKNEGGLPKDLCFKYQFCFGVRLPNQKFVPILSTDATPPCERKRAFRLTGQAETFYLDLFCGLSLTQNSGVIHLASHDVSFSEEMRKDGSLEFIVSVELEDYTKGRFSVILPQGETQTTEFFVPALMD